MNRGRKPACLAEAIRAIHFNYFIHLKKVSRTWSFCNPLLSEMTSESSTLLLQSSKAQAWCGDSCLVWGACCAWFPSTGHIKSRQTGKGRWCSVAWWSWDQYEIQLAQFNSFWGKIAEFCWLLFSCIDAISGDGLYTMLRHLLLLRWITARSAVQPVQHGMCCLALRLSKGHLTGKDQCREEEILARTCPWQCLWIIFESCFPPCWEVFICVYNMHSVIQQQHAPSTELSEQITR